MDDDDDDDDDVILVLNWRRISVAMYNPTATDSHRDDAAAAADDDGGVSGEEPSSLLPHINACNPFNIREAVDTDVVEEVVLVSWSSMTNVATVTFV